MATLILLDHGGVAFLYVKYPHHRSLTSSTINLVTYFDINHISVQLGKHLSRIFSRNCYIFERKPHISPTSLTMNSMATYFQITVPLLSVKYPQHRSLTSSIIITNVTLRYPIIFLTIYFITNFPLYYFIFTLSARQILSVHAKCNPHGRCALVQSQRTIHRRLGFWSISAQPSNLS